MYHVYIMECSDKSLYTGIAKDIEKRLFEHNNSEKGAKYTRSKRPVKLVYSASYTSRSEATKEEYRIKKLNKIEKLKLISTF